MGDFELFHRLLFDLPAELRDPAIWAALIGAGGAAATTLGIGAGQQPLRRIGRPDTVAQDLDLQIQEVMARQAERRDAPIVFPGNQQAFARASGGARIAGLPTGTIGRNPALGSFLRRRQVSLGTGGGIGGDGGNGNGHVHDDTHSHPEKPVDEVGQSSQNQVLLAIRAILEQNGSFA